MDKSTKAVDAVIDLAAQLRDMEGRFKRAMDIVNAVDDRPNVLEAAPCPPIPEGECEEKLNEGWTCAQCRLDYINPNVQVLT